MRCASCAKGTMHPVFESLEPRLLLDGVPPQVSSTSPDGFSAGPVSEIDVTFSEAIDPDTFTLSDVTIVGPQGQSGEPVLAYTGRYVSAVAVSGNTACEATSDGLRVFDVSDSAHPMLVGVWDSVAADAAARDVFISDSYAYMTDGSDGLHVLDVSNPAMPSWVSTFDTTGTARSVVVVGNLAYVADGESGLTIVDVTDKANPSLEGSCNTPGTAFGVTYSQFTVGPTTYKVAVIADGSEGFAIINVNNPLLPTLYKQMKVPTSSGLNSVSGVTAVGSKLYVCESAYATSLFVVDMQVPTTPVVLGSVSVPGTPRRSTVVGTQAFVPAGTGVWIVDVSTPASPTLKYWYQGQPNGGVDVDVVGSKMYVVDAYGKDLEIADVSALVIPTAAGSFDNPADIGLSQKVQVVGDYAYVANGSKGILVLDVSTPGSVSYVSARATQGPAVSLYVTNGLLYVATQQVILGWPGGLEIFDLSTPGLPTTRGSLSTGASACDVKVVGNLAYVANGSAGLQVLNVSDPDNPTSVGSFATAAWANGIDVEAARAYVAELSVMEIIDVTTPGAPSLLGKVNGWAGMRNVDVVGDTAYLAEGGTGVRIFDVSNPASPTQVGTIMTPFLLAQDVTVSGNRAYVANGATGVYIADVSDPASSRLIGTFDTPGSAYSAVYRNNTVYVADGSGGLRAFNVTGIHAPDTLGSYDTPRPGARELATVGNIVYVGYSNGGIDVFDVSNPDQPVLVNTVGTSGSIVRISISGTRAYVGSSTSAELTVLDISTPASPVVLSRTYFGRGLQDLRGAGTVCYVADYDGLQIYDFSTPTSPVKIGSLTTGVGNTSCLAVSGNYAYVGVAGFSARVINVSNPAAPFIAATITVDRSLNDIEVVDNLAYISAYARLAVVDVTNPAVPTNLRFYDTGASASVYATAVAGSVAYIADGSGSLRAIDVSTPTLTLLTDIPGSPNPHAVVLNGPVALVGDYPNGLMLIDVSRIPVGLSNVGGNTWRIDPIDPFPAGGLYQVTIGPDIKDLAGNLLDGDGDGTGGDPYVFGWSPLLCDANADGKVDGGDLARWQQNYDPLGLNSAANTYAKGDWNDDDRIDHADLTLWRQNYDPVGITAFSPAESVATASAPVTVPEDAGTDAVAADSTLPPAPQTVPGEGVSAETPPAGPALLDAQATPSGSEGKDEPAAVAVTGEADDVEPGSNAAGSNPVLVLSGVSADGAPAGSGIVEQGSECPGLPPFHVHTALKAKRPAEAELVAELLDPVLLLLPPVE